MKWYETKIGNIIEEECNECEWIELIEFIRLHLWCTPIVHNVYLYKGDFTNESFFRIALQSGS